MDRVITLRLGYPDRQTELNIVRSRSGLDEQEAGHVVDVVRELRGGHGKVRQSLRAGIAIARILKRTGGRPRYGFTLFHHICYDVLGTGMNGVQSQSCMPFNEMIDQAIQKICPSGASPDGSAAARRERVATPHDIKTVTR